MPTLDNPSHTDTIIHAENGNVLYDAQIDKNVVSWPKLYEAGLFGDFTATEAIIYNAADDEAAGRVSRHDNVYCLEDLAPPSATTHPSRPTTESIPQVSTSELEIVNESAQGSPSSGVISSNIFASPNTLPSESAYVESSVPLNSSSPSATTTKRKLGTHFESSGQAPAKRSRAKLSMHGRIRHQLIELGEKVANVITTPSSLSPPHPPRITRIPSDFDWPHKIFDSNSTPSFTTTFMSSATREYHPPAATPEIVESKSTSSES
ncbi:uncharacterized protein M421DRAFT_401028 [Didymella exigua CBS 183.55]|uniref:Uncharacterized protein n=1 Tax=Didymella exigua CBS 183.55 TaxID=1150837 RepID=A0A6A5RA09_9PLEO|nr:uncharacterized protein M421DRAFT_401028 [Didymella exigua CBS 183.55]KAF1925055.1 hypothetical protein M421DRAFT_401028 [Didymella exigua CBS 183.55]